MEKISNKSIAMLLIATIAVYLGGTFISLSKLSEFGATGFATSNTSANVSVTVTSTTSIAWTSNLINFGTGTVAGTCSNCTMFTNGSNSSPNNFWGTHYADCCVSFANWSDSMLLENTGNNNVSLKMNASFNDSGWFGVYVPQFLGFKIVDVFARDHRLADEPQDTANSCGDTTWRGYRNTAGNITPDYPGWTSLDNFMNISGTFICGNDTHKLFSAASLSNEANFDFIVTIPQTFPGGAALTTAIWMMATS